MSRILAISGSLRAESFNTALLSALQPLAPEGVQIELYKGLEELPHFNQDLEADPGEAVVRLREAVRNADGVIISTPEYNRGYPGFLKNALDWASRPYGQSVFDSKPVAVIAASPSAQGGIRALTDLRTALRYVNAYVVGGPEVAIPEVHTRLGVNADVQHVLTDEAFAGQLKYVLKGLQEAIEGNHAGGHLKPLHDWFVSLQG